MDVIVSLMMKSGKSNIFESCKALFCTKNPHRSRDLPLRTEIYYTILKRLHKTDVLDEYPIYGQSVFVEFILYR